MHALVVVRSRAAALSHALINLSCDSLIISIWELSEKDKRTIQHFPLRPSKITTVTETQTSKNRAIIGFYMLYKLVHQLSMKLPIIFLGKSY